MSVDVIDGQEYETIKIGGAVVRNIYTPPKVREKPDAVTDKKAYLKVEAHARITALDWRLRRARERDELYGTETVKDVLQLREDIRLMSDDKEALVMDIDDVEEIDEFEWNED